MSEEEELRQTQTRDAMVNVDNRDAKHILIENQDGRPTPFVRSFFLLPVDYHWPLVLC